MSRCMILPSPYWVSVIQIDIKLINMLNNTAKINSWVSSIWTQTRLIHKEIVHTLTHSWRDVGINNTTRRAHKNRPDKTCVLFSFFNLVTIAERNILVIIITNTHPMLLMLFIIEGWGLLRQFLYFRYFPNLSALSTHALAIKYHVYIWLVLPPLLNCDGTCQISAWFK